MVADRSVGKGKMQQGRIDLGPDWKNGIQKDRASFVRHCACSLAV